MPSKTDFCVRSLTQLAGSKRLFVLSAANDRKEPMLPRFCSAANVCQSVRHEEEEIDDWLNVDLQLSHFKQVMVKDWGNQTAAHIFPFGP